MLIGTFVLVVALAMSAVVLAIALSSNADLVSPTVTTTGPWQPDVIEHEWSEPTPAANIWTGVIYRIVDDTPVFLGNGVNPLGLESGSELTMTVVADTRLETRFPRALHLVVGEAPPAAGLTSAVEMVWTSGVGIDGSFELDAALQRPVGTAYAFHLQCSTDTGDSVVAVVDADLEAQAAWDLSIPGTGFSEVPAAGVTCW